jgi:hypothetical protein
VTHKYGKYIANAFYKTEGHANAEARPAHFLSVTFVRKRQEIEQFITVLKVLVQRLHDVLRLDLEVV